MNAWRSRAGECDSQIRRHASNTEAKRRGTNSASETWQVPGQSIGVWNPHKVPWPQDAVSTEQMERYYQTVAPFMLPQRSAFPKVQQPLVW